MHQECHRCHRELPGPTPSGGSAGPATLDDDVLFCPRCGAPQIRLPEYLRSTTSNLQATPHLGFEGLDSSGVLPPPRVAGMETSPLHIDWRLALRCSLAVAIVAALLTVLSRVLPGDGPQAFASLLSGLVVLCGAVITLGLYAQRSPNSPLDARLGLRIGLVTGILLVATRTLALGIVGIIARFVTHGMGAFDAELAAQFALMQAQAINRVQGQPNAAQVQQHLIGLMSSPEGRGGVMIAYFVFISFFVLLLSALGGAFAGMLRNPRTRFTEGK